MSVLFCVQVRHRIFSILSHDYTELLENSGNRMMQTLMKQNNLLPSLSTKHSFSVVVSFICDFQSK